MRKIRGIICTLLVLSATLGFSQDPVETDMFFTDREYVKVDYNHTTKTLNLHMAYYGNTKGINPQPRVIKFEDMDLAGIEVDDVDGSQTKVFIRDEYTEDETTIIIRWESVKKIEHVYILEGQRRPEFFVVVDNVQKAIKDQFKQ